MIDDLDRTLEQLLKRELPPALVAQAALTFVAPDAQFPPTAVSLPAIDLFLYDIRENRDLRSNEWVLDRRSDGTTLKTRAPLRVDCSYLITAWASQSSTAPTADEHRLLGEVMRVLIQFPIIPQAVLQGTLKAAEPPLPAASLQPGRLQSMAEFWQAMGGKPKAALTYTVTIPVLTLEPAEAGAAVVDKLLKFRTGVEGA